MTPVPPLLRDLIRNLDGHEQAAVPFRPESWVTQLAGTCPDHVLDVLVDSTVTTSRDDGSGRLRTVARANLDDLAARTRTDDPDGLSRLFLLVQVWGSGLTGRRTPRFTRIAFGDWRRLAGHLAGSAELLRAAVGTDALAEAHRGWSVPGVGPAFFTKWFTFAGTSAGRDWQPLILDSLVLSAINSRDGGLGLLLASFTDRRGAGPRYQGYVEKVHQWARDLGVSAARVEWALFMHGKDLRGNAATPPNT